VGRGRSRDEVINQTLSRLRDAGHQRIPGFRRVSLGDNNCEGFTDADEARRYKRHLPVCIQHRLSTSKKIAGNVPVMVRGEVHFMNDPESFVENEFRREHSLVGPMSPYGADGHFLRRASYNLASKEDMAKEISEEFRRHNNQKMSLDDALRPFRRFGDYGGLDIDTMLVIALGAKAARLVKAGMIPLHQLPLLAANTTTYSPALIFPRIMAHLSARAVILTDEEGHEIAEADFRAIGYTPDEVKDAKGKALPTLIEGWSEGRPTY